MSYKTPVDAVLDHLEANGLVTAGSVFTPSMPDWSELSPALRIGVVAAEVNISSNPKWLMDTVTVAFNVKGKTRSDIQAAKAKAWEIYNFLLGIDNFQIEQNLYLRFLSDSAPRLNAVGANTDPFFNFVFSFMRQGLVPEGNRVPLP